MVLFPRFFKRPGFDHGIHPPQHKQPTAGLPIRRLAFAPRYIIPLGQHIGKPAVPRVRPGQEVVRGEPIADADGFVSVPLHAPVSGVVREIGLWPSARGPRGQAIVIDSYEGSGQEVGYALAQDMQALDAKGIIEAVQASGMVGLGGAAFPSHVKLAVPDGHPIDTLVVNGCECEPYLSADHRIMLEQGEALLRGIRYAMRAVGAEQAVIGVEDNKPDAIAALSARLKDVADIRVQAVTTKYPQGSEKLLITALLGREVPSGGHTFHVGVVVNNVGTLAAMGQLLPAGQGLIERVVTVAGPAIRRPGNYLIPLGTPLSFVLEQVGVEGTAEEVILGGPMMGNAVASLDVPVTKGVSGILVYNEPAIAAETRKHHPCIKCGKCVEACPMHLNPSLLGRLAAKREYELMAGHHLNDCFECGCCSYVCPSSIPLVQYFRIAKAINRERAA